VGIDGLVVRPGTARFRLSTLRIRLFVLFLVLLPSLAGRHFFLHGHSEGRLVVVVVRPIVAIAIAFGVGRGRGILVVEFGFRSPAKASVVFRRRGSVKLVFVQLHAGIIEESGLCLAALLGGHGQGLLDGELGPGAAAASSPSAATTTIPCFFVVIVIVVIIIVIVRIGVVLILVVFGGHHSAVTNTNTHTHTSTTSAMVPMIRERFRVFFRLLDQLYQLLVHGFLSLPVGLDFLFVGHDLFQLGPPRSNLASQLRGQLAALGLGLFEGSDPAGLPGLVELEDGGPEFLGGRDLPLALGAKVRPEPREFLEHKVPVDVGFGNVRDGNEWWSGGGGGGFCCRWRGSGFHGGCCC